MISHFFTLVLYQPLYNALILLTHLLPWADEGVIIIVFTLIIRLALFPLSQQSIRTQVKMREIAPELEQLKAKYKDNREEQAKQMMLFYKVKKINPFAGFLAILIQLPIILALYRIFYNGGLAHIDHDLIYSFIQAPVAISTHFLGLIDLTQKSLIFSITAAASQFLQAQLIAPPTAPSTGGDSTFANDLARSMSFQTKYILPVMIFFFSFALSSAISLYWTVSNLFAVGQELYVRGSNKK